MFPHSTDVEPLFYGYPLRFTELGLAQTASYEPEAENECVAVNSALGPSSAYEQESTSLEGLAIDAARARSAHSGSGNDCGCSDYKTALKLLPQGSAALAAIAALFFLGQGSSRAASICGVSNWAMSGGENCGIWGRCEDETVLALTFLTECSVRKTPVSENKVRAVQYFW